jgi:hypothetical protein
MWIGLIWLTMKIKGGVLRKRRRIFGLKKMLEIYCVAEQLLACRVLGYMDLVFRSSKA